MAPLTRAAATSILVALPAVVWAAPFSTQRATSTALADGLTVSGVRFQQRPQGVPSRRIRSAIQLDREGNVPALWVGLQLQSGQHQYRLQLDAVRVATSALPGGRMIRVAASGVGATWDLLQPGLRYQLPLLQAHHPAAFWLHDAQMPWLDRGRLFAPPPRLAPLLTLHARLAQPDPDRFFEFLMATPAPDPRRK